MMRNDTGEELQLIQRALNAGDESDVGVRGKHGETALHAACRQQHRGVTTDLLAAGADPNALTHEGWTPLMLAVAVGSVITAEELIAAGAGVSCAAYDGTTALHVAATFDQPHTADLLLDEGANVNAVDGSGSTPVLCAVRFMALFGAMHLRCLGFLLAAGANVNIANVHGTTPLQLALKAQNCISIISSLLKAGASTAGVEPEKAPLLLYYAAADDHVDAARELLDNCVDPGAACDLINATTPVGIPLVAACVSGNVAVLRLFVAAGADLDAREADGRTALDMAASCDELAPFRVLVLSGAHVALREIRGLHGGPVPPRMVELYVEHELAGDWACV